MKLQKYFLLAMMLCLAASVVSAAALQREQMLLSDKLVRLHVVANSDSKKDQSLKMKVRDAVLDTARPLLEQADDPRLALQENLDAIQESAQRCLLENQVADKVCVSFGKERFPTRQYDSFALPAGVYTTLRVTIGRGAGHNWWCVVFPSICLSTAGEMEAAAAMAGFTDEELSLITEDGPAYVFKFKFLELLDRLQKEFSA